MEHTNLTFFLGNISRGCTHELVRHRVGIAISQRSTRYVDESESAWAWHPLIQAFDAEQGNMLLASEETRRRCGTDYDSIVGALQEWLIGKGADKFTARKQARGAARGLLGNALCTEMVWTCNLRALRGIIDQRVKAAADAEIRLLFGRIWEEALPYAPAYLRYQKRPCPDGLGFELYDPNAPAEKLKLAEAEIERLRAASRTTEFDSPAG
jgi:thymidylate synthase (FAD)